MPNIPLSQIHPNPNNPRKVITPDMVEAMAASLKAVGLNNPVKVLALPNGTFELISGHIRLAGAQKLGWTEISALVLTRSPQEALLEAILDNRGQQMRWLETYEAIELLLQTDPKPTQQEVASQLGLAQPTVSRAIRVLGALNPNSRDQIYKNFITPGVTSLPRIWFTA